MKRFLNFLGGIAVLGAILSAIAYLLQKRGILKVSVNYDDRDGRPVTRDLDEIVDTAVVYAGDAVGTKVSEIASDVKSTIAQQLDMVNNQLGRHNGSTINSLNSEYED